MGLPAKNKKFELYVDGTRYAGEVPELTLPKIALKTVDHQGGAMLAPMDYIIGVEKIEMDWTYGGMALSAFNFGAPLHDANTLRYVGAYQDDDGTSFRVEVFVRGRITEMDFGGRKPGENTVTKYKTICSYYRLEVDGGLLVEIDIPNNILFSDGVDRMAEINAILNN